MLLLEQQGVLMMQEWQKNSFFKYQAYFQLLLEIRLMKLTINKNTFPRYSWLIKC